MSDTVESRIGEEFAGYRIESVLGCGATGVVYLAEDARLQRKVALKLVAPNLAADARFRERFLREAGLAASLDHSNVVPIYEVGEGGRHLYIAMQHVEGGADVASLLARAGRLEPERTLAIVTQLAGALDAARWSRGLVHGSLEPSVVMVAPAEDATKGERVFLVGFGLRQELPPGAGSAEASRYFDSIDYLAPEQLDGHRLSPRTDVYALGCVLFACLTGEPPFRRDSPEDRVRAHLHEQPPSTTPLCPDRRAGIDRVVQKALAKWPEERYSTCGELAAAARASFAPAGEPSDRARTRRVVRDRMPPAADEARGSVAAPDPSGQRLRERRQTLIAAIGLVVVVSALVAGVWLSRSDTGVERAAQPPAGAETPERAAVQSEEGTAAPTAGADVPAEAEGYGSSTPIVSRDTGSLVRIDARTGDIIAAVPIAIPDLLASDGRSTWVLAGGELARIEPLTNDLAEPFHGERWDSDDMSLAVAGGRPWLREGSGLVYQIAPGASASEVVRFESENTVSVVGAAGSLWVSWFPNGPCCVPPPDLYRVDPATRKVIAKIDGADKVVASGPGFVWVVRTAANTDHLSLARIDTETYETVPIGELALHWADLAVAGRAVWASSPDDAAIVRLDPVTGEAETRVHVGHAPGALAAGAGAVWAALPGGDAVARYDLAGDRITTIDVGGTPVDLVFADDSIWVAVVKHDDPAPVASGTAPPPFVLDLETGLRTPLPTILAGGVNYVPSPDGTRIAFGTCHGARCSRGDVMTIADIDGTDARVLASSEGLNIIGARWSPDGTKLVYQERNGGTDSVGNLFVQDLYGRTQLTHLKLSRAWWWFLAPSFSPDGGRVIFHLPRNAHKSTAFDVWSVPVSGGDPELVLRNASFPMLNPDGPEGVRIEFLSPTTSSPAGRTLMTGRPIAESDIRRTLVEANDRIRWPTLSPDGNRIAYEDGGFIYVVGVRTGERSRVAEGNTAEWVDSETLIVAPSA